MTDTFTFQILPRIGILLLPFIGCFLSSCREESEQVKPEANQINSLTHQTYERTFKLHVPPDYDETMKYPLLIGLHGFSSTGPGFESYTGFSEVADREGFIAAYPNGISYPWRPDNPQAWNAGAQYEEWTRGTDDVGFISKMIDLLVEYYSIDQDRIYVTGHSNGSRMTYRVGAELSCRVAAIAPVAGQMVFDPASSPDCIVPILHLHAVNDSTVKFYGDLMNELPYQPVDSILWRWAVFNECDPQPETSEYSEGVTRRHWSCEEAEIDLYLSEYGEHQWLTEANSGLAANEIIWDFFRRHSR